MSFSQFGPFLAFGDREGERTSASFLARMQQEVNAARAVGAASPLVTESSPYGSNIALDRTTLDLRRFRLSANLAAGGSAEAVEILFDPQAETYTIDGETFTVYDSISPSTYAYVVGFQGIRGWAKWQPDGGRWEIVREPRLVDMVKVTSLTKTSDRYPGKLQVYDVSAKSWANGDDIWVIDANGDTLGLDRRGLAMCMGYANSRLVYGYGLLHAVGAC